MKTDDENSPAVKILPMRCSYVSTMYIIIIIVIITKLIEHANSSKLESEALV